MQKLNKVQSDLDALTELLIQTKSPSLFGRLDELENKKQELEASIYELELIKPITRVSEQEVAAAFAIIRKKLKSGSLENIRQLIQVYVDRIEVWPDEVVI